ncbi:MAG: hypothetical protein FWD98_03670 [Defluviitaleaceae bacterium]|nr:hypothetical protein [Defluviitaleaceae bacterium]
MKQKKPKMEVKRIVAAVIAIFIALVMVMGMLAPLFAAEPGRVTIEDAQIGYGRMHRTSGYTPFWVRLANEGEGDFAGTLRIMVDTATVPSERNFVIYSDEIFLPGLSARDVEIMIPLNVLRRTHRAVVADGAGRVLASRTMFASAIDNNSVLAGILTDDTRGAGRLRWLVLDYDAFRFGGSTRIINERLVLLNEERFPSDIRAISNFEILFIDSFDISRLSEAQAGVLAEWVYAGGTLVKGAHAWDHPEIRRPADAQEVRELTEVTPTGGGTVITHQFALTDDALMAVEGAEAFLSATYSRAINIDREFYDRFRNQGILMMTGNLPSFNDFSLAVILVLVGLYALAIASVLYFALKKRDRREAAIYIIPAMALGVTAVVAVIGFGSGYQQPITSTITRLSLGNGGLSAAAESFTGVHSPVGGDVAVTLAPGEQVRFEGMLGWMPLAMPQMPGVFGNLLAGRMGRHVSSSSARITERDEAEILVAQAGADEPARITFLNRASWSAGHFSRNTHVELDGTLAGEFTFEGSMLVGDLYNNTGMDLHDLVIIIGNTLEHHDFLESGGTLRVSKDLNDSTQFSPWNIAEAVFPFRGLGQNLSPEEGRDLSFRRGVMQNMFSHTGGFYAGGVSGFGRGGVTVISPPSPVTWVPEPRRVAPDGSYVSDDESPHREADPRPVIRHEYGSPISVTLMAYNFDDVTGMDIRVGGVPAVSLHTNLLTTGAYVDLGASRRFDIPAGILRFSAIETDTDFHYSPAMSEFSVPDAGFIEFIYSIEADVSSMRVSWDSPAAGVSKTIYNRYSGVWENIRRTEYSDDIAHFIYNGELRLRAEFGAHSWFSSPGISLAGGR